MSGHRPRCAQGPGCPWGGARLCPEVRQLLEAEGLLKQRPSQEDRGGWTVMCCEFWLKMMGRVFCYIVSCKVKLSQNHR